MTLAPFIPILDSIGVTLYRARGICEHTILPVTISLRPPRRKFQELRCSIHERLPIRFLGDLIRRSTNLIPLTGVCGRFQLCYTLSDTIA